MTVISFKCPHCDGELIFDPASGEYKCEYCLSKFTQADVDKMNQTEMAGSSEDTSKTQMKSEDKTQGGAVIYNCPSCGAEIITDATTAATFCYYCHNPVILSGRLEGKYLPDKIIPFEITKEQAVQTFLDYVGKKKFIPKAFFSKKQIESITGVYFPYWNYNADVENVLQGDGRMIRSWTTGDIRYTETKHYQVTRKGRVTLNHMSENALQKANAEIARGVLPYHFEKMKDFNMGYLSGFMAEKRDIEKDSLKEQMRSLAQNCSNTLMRDTVEGYDAFTADHSDMRFAKEEWQYCLLPVWTITYKGKDGKIYYYSMNGQTGEVCGELPVDKKKLALVSGSVSAVITILGIIGGMLT